MPSNYYMFFIAALIPLGVGAIYYHPKLVGGTWMKANGFTEDSLKNGNMALIFGLSYLFAVILCLPFSQFVIHQSGVVAAAMSTTEPGVWTPEAIKDINIFMSKYGNSFRTFSHGAVHGVIMAIFVGLPIFGINALFERRGAKYIFVHLGYWIITLALMGGLLCQTLEYAPLK